MTRLTNEDQNNITVKDRNGEAMTMEGHPSNPSQRPGAASEEVFGRQANKGILADRVAEELNVPRRTAARVLDAVLDSVRDLLLNRGKVAVKGFGTFERRVRKGRAYKHPLTGKSIDVADKETIIFKPSDQLIEDTNPARARRRKPPRPSNPTPATDDILFKG
jgi:nucleoid DNA-binding protein